MGGELEPIEGEIIDMFRWQPKVEEPQSGDLLAGTDYTDGRLAMAALLRRIYPEKEIDIDKLY